MQTSHINSKMSFKKIIKKIHRWLGFTSGIVVFIVSITGCIFCFHDEIKDITRSWRKVEYQDKTYIAPTILIEKAKEKIPMSTPSMVVYTGRERAAFVYTSINKDNYYSIYFDPYSGDFLHTENLKKDFFLIIENIHLYLLLPPEIGRHVVGISTIIFILMIISGLYLWWPKNKNIRKQRFSFQWKKTTQWKRKNYDIHNILGFYIGIIGIIIAITGLTFSYEWVKDSIYYTANLGGNKKEEAKEPVIDSTLFKTNTNEALDIAFFETLKKQPKAEMFFVRTPSNKSTSILTGAYLYSLRYDNQSNYYFHPSSGDLVKSEPNNEKSTGMRLVEMNYGIHTGQILNLPGKIIAFIVSLTAASLPVTGFMIWWGRKKKSKKCLA